MAKAIKLKDENYLDSKSIVHDKKTLSDILDVVESAIIPTSSIASVNQNYIKKCGNVVEIFYRGKVTSDFSNVDKTIGLIPPEFKPKTTLVVSNACSTGTNEWRTMNNSYCYIDSNDGSISVKGTGLFFSFHITYIV